MNEQIQNILNENGTKTEKIKKLLALGLTRRAVADLVTNGNYGFVQNVYTRMLRDMNTTTAQVATTVIPHLNYTFDRNFGIEIEAYNCSKQKLAQELTAAGIKVKVEDYNHIDSEERWKIISDGSLTGTQSFELVSPILHGEEGLKDLEKVCWVLELCDVKVNNSCGLHIHMDAAGFTLQTWKNLALSYKRLEKVIDAFMPSSRRNNRFCQGFANITETQIKSAGTITDLRRAFGNDRYRKVNLEAYARHRTVEFRQHSGTTNFTKMSAWIYFLAKLIIFAENGEVQNRTTLQNIPFLDDREKIYFKLRTRKLA